MEGTGNSLGALAAAAAATQHAAPAAAVTSQSILRDMRLILSAKDTKLQEKEGELGRMRGELTTAKTTAITHRKTAEELAHRMKLQHEKQLQQQHEYIEWLRKQIAEFDKLQKIVLDDYESFASEIERQKILLKRRTERQEEEWQQQLAAATSKADTLAKETQAKLDTATNDLRVAQQQLRDTSAKLEQAQQDVEDKINKEVEVRLDHALLRMIKAVKPKDFEIGLTRSSLVTSSVPAEDAGAESDDAGPGPLRRSPPALAPTHKTCSVLLHPPPCNGAAAPAAEHPLVGKRLYIWPTTRTEEFFEQFYTIATVTSVEDSDCHILLSDTYGQEILPRQIITVDAAIKAIRHFDNQEHSNPDPPPRSPQIFQVLRISTNGQHRDKFSRNPEFTRLATKAIWYNSHASDTEMKFLWQDLEDGCWWLGPTLQEKTYYTAKPATYAHEEQSWRVRHGDTIISLEICFKAYMKMPQQALDTPSPSTTQQPSPGGAAGPGDSAGAAGSRASTGAAASRASAGAAASRASAGAAADPPADAGAADPPDADAVDSLKPGDKMCLFYPREREKEGYCLATVKTVREGPGLVVAYECHRHNQGQLEGKASGMLTLSQALVFRSAFVTKTFIPHPHPGSFCTVYVTHATGQAGPLIGKYVVVSELSTNGKPVWRKQNALSEVGAYIWYSRQDKWTFGSFAQMRETASQGFAVATESTSWLHYTHDYFVQNIKCKVFSYAIKQDVREPPIDLAASDDENEAGAPAVGGARRMGYGSRKRTNTDRTQADTSQNKRRAAGGGADAADGGADGPSAAEPLVR